MRFAYADPPYLGVAKKHYGKHHADASEYDDPESHRRLIERLDSEYDGWALSLSSPSLRVILPMCPDDVRVCPWVKPWAAFKPGVTQAFAWEPVIVKPVRKRPKFKDTVRDWVSAGITMKRGLIGVKPDAFSYWLFEFAGLQPDDEMIDVFPGSGAVSRAWERWSKGTLPPLPDGLWGIESGEPT